VKNTILKGRDTARRWLQWNQTLVRRPNVLIATGSIIRYLVYPITPLGRDWQSIWPTVIISKELLDMSGVCIKGCHLSGHFAQILALSLVQ
jgi:hypothetical protein